MMNVAAEQYVCNVYKTKMMLYDGGGYDIVRVVLNL